MCGIVGIYDHGHNRPVTEDRLRAINNAQRHRGPDDEGYFLFRSIGLAMRRLSVIDLSGGKQPIANEDRTIHVVFNGEIYNFAELREQLLRNGHQFRSRTDTEVLVHLYEEHGIDFVHQLDGMFAFALYDQGSSKREARLVIARDRLGKKPLYYADVDGTLLFASELHALMRDPAIPRTLDPTALHHYLSLLMVPAPFTIYEAVRKLLPGHMLICDAHGVRNHHWWRLLDAIPDVQKPSEDAPRRVRELLFAAVERRLVSDVPLGAFLSGGLDSSAIVAIMSQLRPQRVKTFSIGFEGPESHNELPYARAVARHCNTDHHEIMVRPDVVELLPELLQHTGEPFAISSAIPTLLLSRAARKEVTVVLTGDGGDELLCGYSHYMFETWANLFRRAPIGLDAGLLSASDKIGRCGPPRVARQMDRVQRFVRNARLSEGPRRIGWGAGFTETEKRGLYSRSFVHSARGTGEFLAERLKSRTFTSPAAWANAADLLVGLPDEMLTKVDRMTMAASLEARNPLLDLSLLRYTALLPFSQKLPYPGQRYLKSVLRAAVSDLLPPLVRKPRKWGFNVPLESWFRTGARSYLHEALSKQSLQQTSVFDPDAVHSLLARHQAGDSGLSSRLYALLVFQRWAEQAL